MAVGLYYNSRFSVFRDEIADDGSGFATVTGTTTIATNEPGRLDFFIPNVNLLGIPGIETQVTYSLFFRSTRQHPINIRENDYVIVVFPIYHVEYNKRLRVRGVLNESLHPQDPHSIIECTLTRIRESRNNSVS